MVVLVVAGVLLSWGHSYAGNQVASQLSAQKIVFPATSSPEFTILPAANRAQMARYAGQPMTTGAQAEVYANYFIGRHLFLIGGGKTYSQLSAEAWPSRRTSPWPARSRPCSRAPRCAACCWRPTDSGSSARSP